MVERAKVVQEGVESASAALRWARDSGHSEDGEGRCVEVEEGRDRWREMVLHRHWTSSEPLLAASAVLAEDVVVRGGMKGSDPAPSVYIGNRLPPTSGNKTASPPSFVSPTHPCAFTSTNPSFHPLTTAERAFHLLSPVSSCVAFNCLNMCAPHRTQNHRVVSFPSESLAARRVVLRGREAPVMV